MVAHVDCNNFYVRCEIVFNPGLDGKPVGVLSNNDGCIISRSDELKALGVKMGAVPHLLPPELKAAGITLFSSNYTLYGDMSDRVMKTLKRFVPRMEIYSIDEAFLDVPEMCYPDLRELGTMMRSTILDTIGLPTCVGFAPTKVLAKMANRYAKKHCRSTGVFCADSPEKLEMLLNNTPVGEVWGVGRQFAEMLLTNNISTAADLANASEDFIRKKMSVVGLRLQKELKGISCLQWTETPRKQKIIGTSRCFGCLVMDKKIIYEALSNYAANCAGKLRKQGSASGYLKVFIHTNPHRLQDEQYYQSIVIQMARATNQTAEIIKHAGKGLDMIFRPGLKYLKCGIELGGIIPENEVQMDLFSVPDNSKIKAATAIMDKINLNLGKDIIRFSAQGKGKSYKARAEHLSGCFTTRVKDLIRIKN